MKILVSGSRGFVGTETTKLLEKEGHEVGHFDLMDGADIRDENQIYMICERDKPDRVLHLAALARFSDCDNDPKLAFETNVIGTKNVVDACKELHIPLVYSSTGSAIMPLNNFEPPYGETVPARGNSVYGCTKAMGEYLVKEHTPHIILRYGHLYGKDKRTGGLVDNFLDRINRGLEPKLYGGQQSNSYVYIKDVARANLLALTAPYHCWNETYNISSDEEIVASEAAKTICDVFDYGGDITNEKPRIVDAPRFLLSTKKAKEKLGFECEYTFEQGLNDMKGLM